MPQIMAFLPLITAVAGPLLGKALGGNQQGSSGGGGGGSIKPANPKPLFNPAQIAQAKDQYTQQGTAKWNQILANMGAGGGTGGPDLTSSIGTQADSLAKALGGLTDQSGYGSDGMGQLSSILKSVEGGISPKYAVY